MIVGMKLWKSMRRTRHADSPLPEPAALAIVVIAALAAAAYAACSYERQPPALSANIQLLHKGRGVVTGVSAPDGYLELKHEPIESMQMPGMQMGFSVPDKQLLEGLQKGDIVEFEMRGKPDEGGDFVIERLSRVK